MTVHKIVRDDLAYESEERRRIMSRDWSKVHVEGDRREPLDWGGYHRRMWRA